VLIDIISDLHGSYPELEGGDLLIVCGDLTARDTLPEYFEFDDWLGQQSYKKKIFIAGNHDNSLVKEPPKKYMMGNKNTVFEKCEYLCDSGTEFEYDETIEEEHKFKGMISYKQKKKLKIWGSPWSLWFNGINPHCKAFTGSESDLKKKYDLIPDDIDILITHTPPELILDQNSRGHHCGSKSLLDTIPRLKNLKLVCFGHLHENGSQFETIRGTTFVNASIMDQNYKAINKPMRIEL